MQDAAYGDILRLFNEQDMNNTIFYNSHTSQQKFVTKQLHPSKVSTFWWNKLGLLRQVVSENLWCLHPFYKGMTCHKRPIMGMKTVIISHDIGVVIQLNLS